MLPRPRTSRGLPWKLPLTYLGTSSRAIKPPEASLLQDPELHVCHLSPNSFPPVSTWKGSSGVCHGFEVWFLFWWTSTDLSSHPAFSLPLPIPTLFLFVLQILFYFDIVFTTIFTIEIALKVKPRPAPLPSCPLPEALALCCCLPLTHTLPLVSGSLSEPLIQLCLFFRS